MSITEDRLVKKAFSKVHYGRDQIDELRNCMHPETGPMYFMKNFMYIQHPVSGRLLFDPYPYQYDLVNTYHNYRKSINMVSRQMGKSTCAAGYLLWYAMFIPDSTILIAAHKHDGALEIMSRVRYCYENIPNHIRAGVSSYNKKSIEFDNGSRILAVTTTENTGRGLAISLIYMDEFAFVERNISEALWTSLAPTLSTGGKCIITSTPDTDEDRFSQIWFTANQLTNERGETVETGPNGFRPFFADWTSHPDRGAEWEAEQRSELGENKFQREHLCKFITFEETLITPETVSGIECKDPIDVDGGVKWFSKISPTNTYVIALDPAMGTGGDNAAIQVFELPTFKQVAEWSSNRIRIEEQVKLIQDIAEKIYQSGVDEIYWSLENNSLGEAALVVIREIGEDAIRGSMLHDPGSKSGSRRKGYNTTKTSKMKACARLKKMLESRTLSIYSRALVSELKVYVARSDTYEAKSGFHDDLISATLLFLRMAEFISSWDDASSSRMSSGLGRLSDDEDDDGMGSYPMPMIF